MPRPKRQAETPAEEPGNMEGAVVDLTAEVRTLAQQVEVLRIAIDDLRAEVEFAVRNLTRPAWVPTQPLTSMPRDPLSHDFVINRTRPEDLPRDEPEATPTSVVSRATQTEPVPIPAPTVPVQKPSPPRTQEPTIALPKQKSSPRKKQRLDLKLYFQPVYADLVRFIGYGGRPLKEVQTFVRELGTKYGQEKVKEAGDAVAVIEGRAEPYTVRLTDEVRKLAVQMLGQPPEAEHSS